MSHQTNIKLCLKDRKALVEALVDCGIPRAAIECYEKPLPVIDYEGRKTKYVFQDTGDKRFAEGDVAHVIVRKSTLAGDHNDLGFFLDKDDSRMIVCEYTKSTGSPVFKTPEGVRVGTDQWIKEVKARYVFHETKNHYRPLGKKVHEKLVDGKRHLFVSL